MKLNRGDLITIALSGDYGKPRPALIMQDEAFSDLPSFAVLRLTSEIHDWPLFRVTVQPTKANGLKVASQIMIDKPAAIPRAKIGQRIGRVEATTLRTVSMTFARFYGISSKLDFAL